MQPQRVANPHTPEGRRLNSIWPPAGPADELQAKLAAWRAELAQARHARAAARSAPARAYWQREIDALTAAIARVTAQPRAERAPNPAVDITDRAKRYRAQAAVEQREKRCIYCGAPSKSGRRVDVEHIDGKEANNNPANLAYSCRPCNTRKGAHFAKRGAGRRTAQFNPSKSGGARSLGQYLTAVMGAEGRERRHAPLRRDRAGSFDARGRPQRVRPRDLEPPPGPRHRPARGSAFLTP